MSFRPGLTLTMQNARTVLDAGLRAIGGGQASIDLGELNAVDSSAVATLLAWQRAARGAGKPLAFLNMPANLQSLVALYGVGELLQTTASRADLPHH
ncbi:STAS domain-containing protein [Oxalobacteraceae bacterium OM1]|nr:STAS domain-containing protein [Oxalobacteraceae bacterium OM1]